MHPRSTGSIAARFDYAQSLVTGPAREDLTGMAWHCYGGPSYMEALHVLAPTLDEIASECSPGIIPYTPSEALIGSFRTWASAVALWNLALDPAVGPVQQPNLGCPALHRRRHDRRADPRRLIASTTPARADQQVRRARCGPDRIHPFVTDFRTPAGVYGVTPGLEDVAFEPGRDHRAGDRQQLRDHGSGSRSPRADGGSRPGSPRGR